MKITTILLFFVCLIASAGSVAQKVTLSENNVKLEKVFKEIKKQTGYVFFYDTHILIGTKRISIDVKNEPLEEVLKESLQWQPLDFSIERKTITIFQKTDYFLNRSQVNYTSPIVVELLPVPISIINGTVKDAQGNPLSGVSVIVKGTQRGISTGADGAFSIDANVGDTLEFTMVGYQKKSVVAGHSKNIIVVMEVEAGVGDEVVVVAHGTQKKKELVGAITTINPTELKIPASNLTNALAGRLAGIIAFQRSGEPGADNADFFVRGVTTFGYRASPLILIDNIQVTSTDLARLQVDDIASFSILKDATASALYGSKGANGVILITTKQGHESKVRLSVRMENSRSQSTRNVALADPVTYMELANEAVLTRNPLGGLLYSQNKIENTKNGVDPTIYPAVDWQKMLLKNSTNNQRFNLNLSGGGKVAQYYVSGALNIDNGILKVDPRTNFNSNSKLTSYSLRSNININLTSTTQAIVRLSGTFDDNSGPLSGGSDIFSEIMQSNSVLFPAYYNTTPDTRYVKHIMFGNAGNAQYNNPYADLQKGYMDAHTFSINAQVAMTQKLSFITEGLSARGMLNIQRNGSFSVTRAYNPFFYTATNYDYAAKTYSLIPLNMNDGQSAAPAGTEYLNYVEGAKTLSADFYSEVALDYRREFNKVHSLSGTLVGVAKNSVNGNAGDLQSSLPFRNLGVSGRVSYVYDNRYAAEFNFGYNGSERFSLAHRYGFFPSIGVAYTPSEEKYWEGVKNVLTKFKLRATYGFVGNDDIGSPSDRFFYLSNVNMNSGTRGMTFGALKNYNLSGIDITRYANNDITWEKSAKTNFGLDATLFGKLNINIDVYHEKRTSILMPRASIPSTMGLSVATSANVGQAHSNGVDVALDYTQQITNKWWAKGMANFTYARGVFDVYEEPQYQESNMLHVGKPLTQQWGYIAERLFVDNLDAQNAPKQNFGPYGGGDIKFRDVNGDGQISTLDQVPLGYPTTPEIVYGFGVSTGTGRFDFSVFFEGLARESFWIDAAATSPFVGDQRQLLKLWADNHWSEDNRNIYALWPRLSPDVNVNNTQTSSWFMRNGALIRLKSAELGFTLPERLMHRLYFSNARFYLNGLNLHTFSKFKLWDPEMGGNGLGYPIQMVLNLGVTLTLK